MSHYIRFRRVEIDSNIRFKGRKKPVLPQPVRSLALYPVAFVRPEHPLPAIPEIFWQ